MTKLSDTQRVILSAASQRTDRLALPLPRSLKGGAVNKVIRPLLEKCLLEEVDANRMLGDPVWRETGDGYGVTFIITDAGLEAIGVEPDTAPNEASRRKEAPKPATHKRTTPNPPAPALAPTERKIREGTKQALIIAMFGRPEGASIAEIAEASGWLSHTIRGMIAGSLKKKLGLEISSSKDAERGRVYKLD